MAQAALRALTKEKPCSQLLGQHPLPGEDPSPSRGSAGTPPFTCVVAVVVGVGHAPQRRVGLVELSAGVVAQLSARVRVALPGFDAFPPPGLVFVIRVILFVLHPEALGFLHEGTFLVLAQ